MKVALGTATAGIVSTLVASRFRSPIPVVSSRTLGSLATTIALYVGYRNIPHAGIKDVFKYASAGSMAFTVGSAIFDIVAVSNIQLPNIVNFAVSTATGVQPMNVESNKGIDVDTNFA
jgi:hypothetical protein